MTQSNLKTSSYALVKLRLRTAELGCLSSGLGDEDQALQTNRGFKFPKSERILSIDESRSTPDPQRG